MTQGATQGLGHGPINNSKASHSFAMGPYASIPANLIIKPIQSVQVVSGAVDLGGTSFTVTYNSFPINGNFLGIGICLGLLTGVSFTSVTQTGVTWIKAVENDVSLSGATLISMIYYSFNPINAGKVITITANGNITGGIGIACEYSGFGSSSYLDVISSNGLTPSTGPSDSGTTSATTGLNELLLACLTCGTTSGTFAGSPTNSFSSLAVATAGGTSVLREELCSKITSKIGILANTSDTAPNMVYWDGCMATFVAIEQNS